jgi:hypothetical protein
MGKRLLLNFLFMKRFPRLSIRQEKTLCFAPSVLDRDHEAAIEDKSDFKYKKLFVVYLTLQLQKSEDSVKNCFMQPSGIQNVFKTFSKIFQNFFGFPF